MDREVPVQYVTSGDGVRIAFVSVGEGPTIVFASNTFGDVHCYRRGWSHVRDVTDGLASRGWRVVRQDLRGMGESDRSVADLSLDARVADVEAVVEASGVQTFALVGVSSGSPVAMAYAAAHPGDVTHLLLVSPFCSGAELFDIPEVRARSTVPFADRDWAVFQKVLASIVTEFDDNRRIREQLVELIQSGVSPDGLAAFYEASKAIDVTDTLDAVTCPTLVLHETGFPFGSLELSRTVADHIAGSSFVAVESRGIVGTEQQEYVAAIDAFVRSGCLSPSSRKRSVPRGAPDGLTRREAEVLGSLATGLSNKEIAAALGVAVSTVERHLVHAYAKVGARGRADATVYALRNGLVS